VGHASRPLVFSPALEVNRDRDAQLAFHAGGTRMRLLDLFCGAGGAAAGYEQAGFAEILGVDIKPQPNYPYDFMLGDALEVGMLGFVEQFDAIHASPPCQGYSRLRHLPWLKDRDYPRLIEPTREMLIDRGIPFVIENVEDAPLSRAPALFGGHGLMLCGQMFDLPGQFRHRRFESSVILAQPPHRRHTFVMQTGRAVLGKRYPRRFAGITDWQESGGVAGHFGNKERAERSMGIDWMTVDELRQAIPPAMTKFIGTQLLEHLRRAA
jgi:DNA (cytosine-5)-methyltransferase 1